MRGGTCFLVKYHGDLWVVSTRHAFNNLGFDYNQARILWSVDERRPRFLRLADTILPLEAGGQPRDVVLFRSHDAPARFWRLLDLSTAEIADLNDLCASDWFRVSGFPNSLDNAIDYETLNVSVSRALFDGEYLESSGTSFEHLISFASTGVVASFNGMSGGPVFHTRPGSTPWRFAGMLIGEGRRDGRHVARFIDGQVLARTLDSFYRDAPRPA